MDLALDHNFPESILRCLDQHLADPKLIPLRHIHPDLPGFDDRRMLIALYQLGYPGLITNDYRILRDPWSLAALLRTRLTVFAMQGVGDSPIRATGALLLDLPSVIPHIASGDSGVFWLRPRNPEPQAPWELFKRVVTRRGKDPVEVYGRVRISDAELATPMTGHT